MVVFFGWFSCFVGFDIVVVLGLFVVFILFMRWYKMFVIGFIDLIMGLGEIFFGFGFLFVVSK